MIRRNYSSIEYSNGLKAVFDPLVRWYFDKQTAEISFRGGYGIGVHRGLTIGTWSRYKTKWMQLGNFMIYLHLGECEPYNPKTGVRYT